MDTEGVLYIRIGGAVYRVKVFAASVGVERQPGGDNLMFERADHASIFDGQTWDLDALRVLIARHRSAANAGV